jgi:hypothetical protein
MSVVVAARAIMLQLGVCTHEMGGNAISVPAGTFHSARHGVPHLKEKERQQWDDLRDKRKCGNISADERKALDCLTAAAASAHGKCVHAWAAHQALYPMAAEC